VGRGNQKAVVDGKLRHVSVSQVKTFLRCPRLWWREKVLGERPPPTRKQERGTTLHRQPELWYKEGVEATHEAFVSALPSLPERHADLLAEASLEDPTLFIGGVRFEAHSDLIVPPHVSLDGYPHVFDWKFVSSFGYMQDPATDLQMLCYAKWCGVKWPEASHVGVNLCYFKGDGSDWKFRRTVVTTETAEEVWQGVVIPTVQKMEKLASSVTEPEGNFTNDYEACKQYGGCYFRGPCGVPTKSDKVTSQVLKAFDEGL
jgi:hypothetical protein